MRGLVQGIFKTFPRLFCIATLTACATHRSAIDFAGHTLPPGMQLVCQQRVDDFGGDGRAPTSIFWQSHASGQDPAAVVEFYRQRFNRLPVPDERGAHNWALDEGMQYSVVSGAGASLWLNCDAPPTMRRTVVLVSKISRVR